MKNEWSKLRTSLNFNSKTFKFHDSIHKPRRIRLFGPLKIMSCRPFEKFHFTVVKQGSRHTNKKNMLIQLANQYISSSQQTFELIFLKESN